MLSSVFVLNKIKISIKKDHIRVATDKMNVEKYNRSTTRFDNRQSDIM